VCVTNYQLGLIFFRKNSRVNRFFNAAFVLSICETGNDVTQPVSRLSTSANEQYILQYIISGFGIRSKQCISRYFEGIVLTNTVVLGMYANDFTLVIELVVESHSLKPSLHPDLVGTSNAGHGVGGGCTISVCEGCRNYKNRQGTHMSAKIPTSAPRLTTYQYSGNSSISGGFVG
jgi:hypothetical protein